MEAGAQCFPLYTYEPKQEVQPGEIEDAFADTGEGGYTQRRH